MPTGHDDQDPRGEGATGRLLTARARALLAAHRWGITATLWLALRALQLLCIGPNQDVQRYFRSAGLWLAGSNPYEAMGFEYPPAALALFTLVRLGADSLGGYRALFAAAMLAVDLAVVVLVGRAAMAMPTRLPRDATTARADATVAMALYIGLTALMRGLPLERYDPVMVLALVGWLAAAWGGRRTWVAEAFLALGIATKLVPVVLVPLHLAWAATTARPAPGHARDRLRAAAVAGLRLAAMVAVPTVPMVAMLGPATAKFFAYHQERGLQIESLWSALLMVAHDFAGTAMGVAYRFGCMEVTGASVPSLVTLASVTTAAGVVAAAAWSSRQILAAPDAALRAAWLLRGTLAVIATFMALNKVLSTQYVLWLAPLFALAGLLPEPARVGRPLVVGGAALTFVTTLLLHFYYRDLVRLDPLPAVLLLGRDLTLLACAATAGGLVFGERAGAALAAPWRHRAWAGAALALGAIWATVGNLSETTANDIWIQLRSGADILATHQFPSTEIYSSTVYGRPFIAHEWLSGVIFAGLVRAFGGAGLSFLAAATALMTYVLLYFSGPRSARRTAWYGVLLLALVYLVSFRILVRPHIFTILAQATMIVVLERWRRDGRRWPLATLVPLQLAWVNLHGAAFFGPALLALLTGVVGLMVVVPGLQRGSEPRRLDWPDVMALASTTAAMAAACLVNPYGLTLLRFSFELFNNDYAKTRIWEWTSPFLASNLHYYWFWLYCAALALLWASIAVRARQWPIIDTVVATVVTFLSVRANRFVPDLALFAFPIVARSLATVAAVALPQALHRRRPWLDLGFASLLLGNAVTYGFAHSATEHRPAIGWGFGGDMPYQEVALLQKLHARGIIFNEYSDGALIIYALYPDVRVVLDSRIDLYPWDVVDEYDRAYMSPDLFGRYLDRHHVDYAMLFRNRSHPGNLALLANDPRWQLLSATNGRVLYRRVPAAAAAWAGAEALASPP